MNNEQGRRKKGDGKRRGRRLAAFGLLPVAFCLCSVGCTWDRFYWFTPPPVPSIPESFTLSGDGLKPEKARELTEAERQLAGGHEYFRQGKYYEAERTFHFIAEEQHNGVTLCEEARYYEAESLRLQNHLPKAKDTYNRLLQDFPYGLYKEQSLQHMFDIANYWLDDTRQEMRETKEVSEGKRWLTTPHFWHIIDPTRPLADEEGHALETLSQVKLYDIKGPLSDKALFLSGSVNFFNEHYKEADQDFTQLLELCPNSAFAQQSVELGIIAKSLSTGGPDYDSRKTVEARQLVQTAYTSYPELREKKQEFLSRELMSITYQQAEKDFKIAEFYRRTGHEGPAYFQYEIVRRRYPGTKFFDLATDRMHELRAKHEDKLGAQAIPPIAAPAAPRPLEKLPATPGLQQVPEQAPPPRPLNQPEQAPPPRKTDQPPQGPTPEVR